MMETKQMTNKGGSYCKKLIDIVGSDGGYAWIPPWGLMT